jgi:hypothetical protein
MRPIHPAVLLVGAGAVSLAWTSAAQAQESAPAATTNTTTQTTQTAPGVMTQPTTSVAAAPGAQTTSTTNPDGSVTTTTIVTAPVVVQPAVVGTTKTTSFIQNEQPTIVGPLAAPINSLEMTLGTVYEQPFGRISQGQTLSDNAGGGGGLHLGLAYRLAPEVSLGLYGTGAMFGRTDTADPSTHVYTASAGIQADWHFRPEGRRIDPWISLGSGWRGYWMNQAAGITAAQGWEIARLQGGVDIRTGRDFAIGPVVGADITTFFAESSPSQSAGSIYNPWANTFFFAGLQGRFDALTTLAKSQVASR